MMYQRNKVLFIHLPVFNQLELNNVILTNNLIKIVRVVPGMNRMMLLINSYINGVWSDYFQNIQNLLKES